MYTAKENRYEIMTYNRCGNSGLMLPAVSLGLWHNFGSCDRFDKMRDMVTTAFDNGITHFDLANNYGPYPGSAEENFGKLLKNELAPYRNELVISSKAGYRMWPGPYGEWGNRKYLISSLDESLKRMGLDYVDIFYSHRFDPDTPLEETMGALDSIVRQGKALYVGISSYDAEQTKRAIEILGNLGTPLLIHQPQYNMFNRWIEHGLTDVLEQEGVGSIAFCPLAQGLLTDRYLNSIPSDSRAAKEPDFLKNTGFGDDMLAKLRDLNALAALRGQTLAQMTLAWALKVGKLTSVLIGASRPAQILDNIQCLQNPDFTASELEKINRILNG